MASVPTPRGDEGGEGDDALAAVYAQRARAGDAVYRFRPETSSVRIVAFRSGRVARLGHNHVLTAPVQRGVGAVGPDGAAGSRFDLAFRLDALVIDDPAQRAALGPAFASTLSADAVAGTRDHLLGDGGLQAARWPVVRIRSLRIVGEAPVYAAEVEVELHGQRHSQPVALNVSGLPERLVASGALVLRQSDFGVQPYSVGGGLLAVADEVVIDFRLVGER